MKAQDYIDWDCQEMDPGIRDKLELALGDPRQTRKAVKQIQHPNARDPEGEPEGVIQSVDHFDKSYHGSTILILKEMGEYLNKHYHGWAWVIQANEAGQMFELMNHHLHDKYAYRIRMQDIMYDPTRAELKKGAGETLERYGMLRQGLVGENLANLAHALRDGAGNCIPDISDLEDKKAATQAEVARKVANGDITYYEVNGQAMVRIKK